MFLDIPLSTLYKLAILRYCRDRGINPSELWFCERGNTWQFMGFLRGLLVTSDLAKYYPSMVDGHSLYNAFQDIGMIRCNPGPNVNNLHPKCSIKIYNLDDSMGFLAEQEARMSTDEHAKFFPLSAGIWVLTADQCERENPARDGCHNYTD